MLRDPYDAPAGQSGTDEALGNGASEPSTGLPPPVSKSLLPQKGWKTKRFWSNLRKAGLILPVRGSSAWQSD